MMLSNFEKPYHEIIHNLTEIKLFYNKILKNKKKYKIITN